MPSQKEDHAPSPVKDGRPQKMTTATHNVIRPQKRRSKNPTELQEVNDKMNTSFTALNEVLIKKSKEISEDEWNLYGKLLAKKLRQFTELERAELMYEIDGLVLKKRAAKRHSFSYINANIPSVHSVSPCSSLASPTTSLYSSSNSVLSPPCLLIRNSGESEQHNSISVFTDLPTDAHRQTYEIQGEAYNVDKHYTQM